MSVWLDTSYAKQISYRLELYKEKSISPYVSNFRCPLCNDSAKKKNKKRGYLYVHDKEDSLMFKCWNCNASMYFGTFLKTFDKNLYDRYILDKYKTKNINVEKPFEIKPSSKEQPKHEILIGVPSIDDFDDDHPVKKYVVNRMIPEQYWCKIFYVDKFFTWAKKHTPKFEHVYKEQSRLVFPWYNDKGEVFAYSARSLNGEEPKYYKIVIDDKEKQKFYGVERLNEGKQVYVVEGPVDSLFLPNCIAVGTSKLDIYKNDMAIYIPDKDVRNFEILKLVEKLINKNMKVCLIPNIIKGKDINDYIENGLSPKQVLKLINDNTFQGLTAKLKFTQWKKIELKVYKGEYFGNKYETKI